MLSANEALWCYVNKFGFGFKFLKDIQRGNPTKWKNVISHCKVQVNLSYFSATVISFNYHIHYINLGLSLRNNSLISHSSVAITDRAKFKICSSYNTDFDFTTYSQWVTIHIFLTALRLGGPMGRERLGWLTIPGRPSMGWPKKPPIGKPMIGWFIIPPPSCSDWCLSCSEDAELSLFIFNSAALKRVIKIYTKIKLSTKSIPEDWLLLQCQSVRCFADYVFLLCEPLKHSLSYRS